MNPRPPADPAPSTPGDAEASVHAANAGFYAAFEGRDLDAMAEVWERSDRATVTHPGWPTLHGWARVAGSWDAIFRNTPYIQFVLTDETVWVAGDVAWVTVDEHILQAAAGDDDGLAGGHVTALNLFVRAGDAWRMVAHHGSPVGGA
ncbi:MAG: nuclear transport factor 2 family protein [Actinobacteria bacterium]|nr:nuclear transport factor 2 family protein [Actinomycetota bacterium]